MDTRNFGAPVLSEVLLPPTRNFVIIERTTNVTNIYYRRQGPRTVVYNDGPNFGFINSRVERPIPRLQIERHDDPGFLSNGLRGGGNPTLVRNGVLNVATPAIAHRPMNFAQVKPARIKQSLSQPQVVRGWSNSGDPAAAERIRAQYKQQAAAAPVRPANPVIPPAAQERDRTEHCRRQPAIRSRQCAAFRGPPVRPGRWCPAWAVDGRRTSRPAAMPSRRPANSAPTVRTQSAAASATTAPGTSDADKEARRAARQQARANGQSPVPAGAPSQSAPPAAQLNADQEKEARRAARQQARASGQPAAAPEGKQAPPFTAQPEGDHAARPAPRQQEQAAQPAETSSNTPKVDPEREARRAARQQERAGQADPQAQQAPQAQADQEARRAARQQERAAQPERQAQPQPQAQSAATPAREARHEEQGRQGKPGQSPNP